MRRGQNRIDFGESEALRPEGLCRKSVHGSTGSPRTDHGGLDINYLAVRPELVEGRDPNCDTVSKGRGRSTVLSVLKDFPVRHSHCIVPLHPDLKTGACGDVPVNQGGRFN